jgi:hypothetical protein
MKYLFILILAASCCKKEKIKECYKINSYKMVDTSPQTYEVTAVNIPLRKSVVYHTNQLPIIGKEICL